MKAALDAGAVPSGAAVPRSFVWAGPPDAGYASAAGEVSMSGQLVIAELEAFRAVLGKATRPESETIKLWSRSTITNALHRVGPTDLLKAAADQAWSDADAFAALLANNDVPFAEAGMARGRAIQSIDALIAAVRAAKASRPPDIGPVDGTARG